MPGAKAGTLCREILLLYKLNIAPIAKRRFALADKRAWTLALRSPHAKFELNACLERCLTLTQPICDNAGVCCGLGSTAMFAWRHAQFFCRNALLA